MQRKRNSAVHYSPKSNTDRNAVVEISDVKKGEEMTQKETVLKHLQAIGGITPMEAFNKYGITRLGGIVYFLRKDGHPIVSKLIPVKNRAGQICHVSEYRLEGE